MKDKTIFKVEDGKVLHAFGKDYKPEDNVRAYLDLEMSHKITQEFRKFMEKEEEFRKTFKGRLLTLYQYVIDITLVLSFVIMFPIFLVSFFVKLNTFWLVVFLLCLVRYLTDGLVHIVIPSIKKLILGSK